ncbi:MAG: hypothetical protein KatS3mg111_3396 [Pirellulaceae bacterium]|nr:MAG: hypothetical protein KatS3mg111_3396 [Pirellulaceae bacterium]
MESPTQQRISYSLIRHAVDVVLECNASKFFLYAHAVTDELRAELERVSDRVVLALKTDREQDAAELGGRRFVRVPDVRLNRLGQAKVALFLAVSKGIVQKGEIVAFLLGEPNTPQLDTLFVTEVGTDADGLIPMRDETFVPPGIKPEVVERVIDIAAELGSEGREGKPVGALFVIGDSQRVMSLTRQLIINPFRGYAREERNVLDPALEETVKELSTIDGAFIIDGDGTIETCGAYLKTALQDEDDYALPRGLGARHHAAAGITAVTDSVAVAVSESTGTVTVFREGKIITELEKLRHGSI